MQKKVLKYHMMLCHQMRIRPCLNRFRTPKMNVETIQTFMNRFNTS